MPLDLTQCEPCLVADQEPCTDFVPSSCRSFSAAEVTIIGRSAGRLAMGYMARIQTTQDAKPLTSMSSLVTCITCLHSLCVCDSLADIGHSRSRAKERNLFIEEPKSGSERLHKQSTA